MNQTHSGTGILVIDGDEHACQYRLEITQAGGLKSGEGFVVSTPDALWAGFTANRCIVRMDSGRSFPIIVTNYQPGNGDAAFKMAGAFIDE